MYDYFREKKAPMRWVRFTTAAVVASTLPFAAAQSADTPDYEFFKTRVQPIFLKKRTGRGRCVFCHGEGGAPGGFGLEPLAKGSANWTEEQTRKNYQIVLRMIAPGEPTSSALLMHPLSPAAGGDIFHGGGRQFDSQDDPDWRTLAEWVKQAKPAAYSNLKILTPERVGYAMYSFDTALGVDCNFCHGRDFSADTNPMKDTARRMITMVGQIGSTARVTCYTCHRAEPVPRNTPVPATE